MKANLPLRKNVFLVLKTLFSTSEYLLPSANLLKLLSHKMWVRHCGTSSGTGGSVREVRPSQPAVSMPKTQPELDHILPPTCCHPVHATKSLAVLFQWPLNWSPGIIPIRL